MRDPYEILQVSPRAEPEVIEAAYRRLARKYHPDVNPSPTGNAMMKDLNWAYEILGNPLERSKYDRTHRTPAPSGRCPSYSTPSPPPPTPEYYPPPTSAQPAHPEAPAPERSYVRRHWRWIVLALATVYFIARWQGSSRDLSAGELGSGAGAASGTPSGSASSVYADCITWREARLYDAQVKCVIGRIVVVTHQFDTLSGSDLWTAHFSFDPNEDFRLVSVDRDISQWQGKCVSVYGKLSDRDLIREYVDDPQPSMVDADPLDDRGFAISAAPEPEC